MSEEKPKAIPLSSLIHGSASPAPRLSRPRFERYLVDSRVYKNQTLNLDGYTFKNCAFVNCALTVHKGHFVFEGCFFSNCSVSFSGTALKVVKLSSLFIGTWDQLIEEFRAGVEQDGGFTIR